jgi:probable HAF family extracellular repeat protein
MPTSLGVAYSWTAQDEPGEGSAMGKRSIGQGSASWVAWAATFLLLLFMHFPTNAEIIEVRLEVRDGWLTTCTDPCYEDEYRDLSGARYLVTFAYDTDRAGPDLAPLDPGVGLYRVPIVGGSVRLEGEMPFSFACGLVNGRMTTTPCTGGGLFLGFYDESMALKPNYIHGDYLTVELRFGVDGKYLEFTHGHQWGYNTACYGDPFLNGDSITQLPLPWPNMPIGFCTASLIHFGDASRWYEDESAGSQVNSSSVIRDAGAPLRYDVVDLGTLGGGSSSAHGINNAGEVVGTSGTAVPTEGHAFLYSAGLMHDLGTLGGEDSFAYSIDAFGRVTGYANPDGNTVGRAYLYESGTMKPLETLGGLVNQGNSINDSGHVAGWSEITGRTAYHAFYFDGTRMQDLGTLGGTRSEGYAINESGVVVGRSYTTDDTAQHAFIFDGSGMRDLGTLGGSESAAYGVNDTGLVVGTSQIPGDTSFRAFVYDGTEIRQMGNLHNSVAYSINSSGRAVGDYVAPNTESHGFLFDGVTTYDLNSLIDPASGWTIRGARAINDLGQIAALGCNASYQCRAVRLDPIRTGIWLAGLSLKQPVVAGCKSVSGSIKLSAPAPAGGVVVRISDSLASASSPTSVTIPAGETARSFTIKTAPVAASQMGVVTAELGEIRLNHGLMVRPMGLSGVKLSPSTVVGGRPSTGTATLECAAGPGPVTVDLSTSNPAIAHPVAPTVVVPQGLKSQTFTVATNPVLSKSSAMIAGEASTTTKSRRLNVVPAAAVSSTRLSFGSISVGQTSGALSTILRNDGVVPFAVNGISVTGTYASWFAQTNNCPASLAPGASCTVSVTFTPLGATSKSAKLSIATSATSAPLSVSLSGTGI